MTTPRWATAVRKTRLVQLWRRYGNRCFQGHFQCREASHYDRDGQVKHVPLGLGLIGGFLQPTRLYGLGDQKIEEAVRYWVSDDAAQRMAEWQAERERLHQDQRHFRQGEFDSLRRQIYLESQPPYAIVALTVDSLTFRPVALVRISSTIIGLFVNLEEPMGALSKSARRKARRYGKALPEEAAQKAEKAIAAAVQDWWSKRK
ncbi:MAG: hypothetical protein Q8P22_05550 [Chloroflexota bacterium]|nr:hypothetical protein [Chloroflexota bacterium]